MRLNQRQDRLPPLQAPIPTKMVVSASVASVRVRAAMGCCSSRHRSTSRTHRVQHVHGEARDVHGLLIAGGVGPCPLLCALLLQLIKSKRCSADCRTHGLGARHSAVAAKACGTCHAVLLQLI